MAEDGELVQLYVYDLSGGIARTLSRSLLGQQVDGVWHTAVVVGGVEHFFGGGINVAPAGTTPFGRPVEIVELGRTFLPADVRDALLADLAERYTPESYSLLSFNCNTFSDELAQLLTGARVPAHITGLPQAVLATPFGQMLRPTLAGLEAQLRGMRQTAVAPAAPPAAPPAAAPRAAAPPSEAPAAGEPAAAAPHVAAPAVEAAEHELDAALAETMLSDLDHQLEELDVKEGRGNAADQLSHEDLERLATEAAVRREFERLMAAGGGGADARDAEAAAVEQVAAARRRAAAAEARQRDA